MKNKIKQLLFSIVITVTLNLLIAGFVFNHFIAQPVTNQKIVEAGPIFLTPIQIAFWRAVKYWFGSGGGTGKNPFPKPQPG